MHESGGEIRYVPASQEADRSRLSAGWQARAALLLFISGGLGLLTWGLWPKAHAFAVEVHDRMGMGYVEGHAGLIAEGAQESQVDPYLIAAVMFMESRGRGGQTSYAGALGLMQLIPDSAADAARRLGLQPPTSEQVLEDDRLNVRLGACHLAWLLRHRGEWSLEAVLVSYNAGRARLMGWMDKHGGYAGWRAREIGRLSRGEECTGALEYALAALAKRIEFMERAVIQPVEGVLPVE